MVKMAEVKELIAQRLGEDTSIMCLLYQCYESRAEWESEMLREYFAILKECTRDMPYELANRISSTVNAICVEYERMAFLDGAATSAKLILKLTGE